MSDLRRELELLRTEVEFPPAPDIAPEVRRRLGRSRPGASPRSSSWARSRLALALAAALVPLAAVAAVPSARDAVLDLFGLDGATVEVRPELPAGRVAPDPELGARSTLDEARRAAGFDVLAPSALGAPEAVFFSDATPGGEVTLSYDGGRLLVSQFQGDRDPNYIGKIVPEVATVERFRGGVWIEGAPHFFFYRTPDGGQREDSLRLAGNVLLVERGELLVRIEGAPSRERALEIYSSLR